MSQAKIDQYKKEKANRKDTLKKDKAKKKIITYSLIAAGIILAALLILGIISTVKAGGLTSIKEKQDKAAVTQELIQYLNSNSEDSLQLEE